MNSKMTRELANALQAMQKETANFPWDGDFKRLLRGAPNNPDGARFKSKAAGVITVDVLVDEDALDKLRDHAGSDDLMNDVPNISLSCGNKVVYLTWNEAYNLGQALIRMAETCYFG